MLPAVVSFPLATSALFEQFLAQRRYLKNVTPSTIEWYETAFKALQKARDTYTPIREARIHLGGRRARLRVCRAGAGVVPRAGLDARHRASERRASPGRLAPCRRRRARVRRGAAGALRG